MTFRSAALTIFICILFGGNAVSIKFCLAGLGSFTAAGIRFAIAALIIIAWARFRKTPLKLNKKQLGQTLGLGCIFMVQLSFFYIGLKHTSASHGVLISNAMPFFVLVLAHFFIPGETITLKKLIGMILGFTGVVLLFFDKPDMSYDFKTGDLFVLGSVTMWAIAAVRVKQIIAGYNATQITLFPMMFSVPFFFTAGYFFDEQMIKTIDVSIIAALFYQTVITTSFGFVVWNTLLKKYGATALHSFVFIMPLAGVCFSILLLKETVTPYLAGSVLFVATGIAIVNIGPDCKFQRFS